MSDVYVNRKPSTDDENAYTQGSTSVDQFETTSSISDEEIAGQKKEEYLALVNGIVNASNNRDFYSLNQMIGPLVGKKNVVLLDSICALHWCCYSGHVDLVNQMLDIGCDPFLPDPINYESPVYYAIKGSNAHIISILLKTFGPLILCHENRKSKTPFMVAVSEFTEDDLVAVLHVLEFLYLSGVSLEEQDCNGTTPLMFACKRGQLFVVQWLLKKGADISHRDHFGATVMHYAVLGSSREVVRFLAQNGMAQMANTKAVSNSFAVKKPLDQTPLNMCMERASYSQYYLLLVYWYQWRVFGRVITLSSLYPVVYWIMSVLNIYTFYRMWNGVYDAEKGLWILLRCLITFIGMQVAWIGLKIGDPGVSNKAVPDQTRTFSPTNNRDLTPFEGVLDSLHKRQQVVNFEYFCIKMDLNKHFFNKHNAKRYRKLYPSEYGNDDLLEPLNEDDEENPFMSRISTCNEELNKITTEMRSVYPQVANERCQKNSIEYNNAVLKFDKSRKVCLTCSKPRAVREHHCATCNTCLIHQDHHCDWVNNCVAAGNQRLFSFFLVVQSLALFQYFVMVVRYITTNFPTKMVGKDVLMLTYGIVGNGHASILVGHLLIRLFRAMLTDVTYYEFLKKPNYIRARYRGNVHDRFWDFKHLTAKELFKNMTKFWTYQTRHYEEELV